MILGYLMICSLNYHHGYVYRYKGWISQRESDFYNKLRIVRHHLEVATFNLLRLLHKYRVKIRVK